MRVLWAAMLAGAAGVAWAFPCDSEPGLRRELAKWGETRGNAPSSERRRHIEALAARYPDSFTVQAARLSFYRSYFRELWPGLMQSYLKRAEQDERNPLALALAAEALYGRDTPRAIRLLEQALEIAPGYPWAALRLADIYHSGKFEDIEKARRYFEIFAGACGENLTRPVDWLLGVGWIMGKVAAPETQAAVARAMRARLERETDTEGLLDYELLWALEFRTTPPAGHGSLRTRVAADVARLEKLNPKPDSRWLGMLLSGLKQSGAPRATLEAFEDRILKEAPSSALAYRITYERWEKQHRQPEDHRDGAAWAAWEKAYRAALKQWAKQFKEARWLESSYLRAAIEAGEMTEKEAVAALTEQLEKELEIWGPSSSLYLEAATSLVRKAWAPKTALGWVEKAWVLAEAADRRRLEDDTLKEALRKQIEESGGARSYAAPVYLRVLQLAGRRKCPPSLRAYVERPLPSGKSGLSDRYWAMARLAALEDRTADALAFYQAALSCRERPPRHFRGKLNDELAEEAKAAFLKARGSEKALALWSQLASPKQELIEGRWEKPQKPLPAFELADLSGKIWKLKDLEGKALLINLWATWCGPCRSELPHLQKLYEKTKERSDVQVLSFNVDEEPGLVEPFLKEHNFTFPVLLAYGFVRGLFDGYGIPQNWLIDPKGNWIATQIGFDASDSDWVGSMTRRLEDARQGKPPAGMTE